MRERFGIQAELRQSSGGVFEVAHDGELVYSKKATKRFPDPGEVEAALAERLGGAPG